MYSTCLFCHGDLGTNESVEHFPVGRGLAFDAAKGRLWVVCTRCGRWNLTPLEERWEAIEECERYFRDTRLRVSTDQVGLARLRSGLELVRIGEPLRGEMAAWRYGDQFGRRRRSALIKVGLGAGAVGAAVLGGVSAGVITGVPFFWMWVGRRWVADFHDSRRVARLATPHGVREVRRRNLQQLRLRAVGPHDYRLDVTHDRGWEEYSGPEALRMAGQMLPLLNGFGATDGQVRSAVGEIERVGDPERYFNFAAQVAQRAGVTSLARYPREALLALEMAAHEEQERRALEGELAALEAAWKEAEEIAAIADDLFLPTTVGMWLAGVKKGV